MNSTTKLTLDRAQTLQMLRDWAKELGFDQLAIAKLPPSQESIERYRSWIASGMHGEMAYLEKNLPIREAPEQLVPQARSAIMVTMPYLPVTGQAWRQHHERQLEDGEQAVIAAYALGRDYHKVLKQRLQQLAQRLQAVIGPFEFRVFTDSAPIMEVELAQQAGLGWRGKHTLLLNREGSWFFIGEILTDLDLTPDQSITSRCGTCQQCIQACPTQAIIAPYVLDARRCISYLTIEYDGVIPEALRPAIGTRVYGCDDCQTACPWNKFAQSSSVSDFDVRHHLDHASVVMLWSWRTEDFDKKMQGSAIRRIGYERWRRNLAVAMGNLPTSMQLIEILKEALVDEPSELVRVHLSWALSRHLRQKTDERCDSQHG